MVLAEHLTVAGRLAVPDDRAAAGAGCFRLPQAFEAEVTGLAIGLSEGWLPSECIATPAAKPVELRILGLFDAEETEAPISPLPIWTSSVNDVA